MEITRELLIQRLEALTAQREQALATANAVSGAIQEVEAWMKHVSQEGPALEAVPDSLNEGEN